MNADNVLERLRGGEVNVGGPERVASAVAGGALLLGGLRRGSGAGALLALAGGVLLHRGATGHCMAYEALGIDTAGGDREDARPASSRRDPAAETAGEAAWDDVDEAADESFPASDPPSWTP